MADVRGTGNEDYFKLVYIFCMFFYHFSYSNVFFMKLIEYNNK